MRVLTVLLDVPVPATTGLHLRQLAILRLLRELGCESHILVFTTRQRPEIRGELAHLCDQTHDGGRRIEYSTLGVTQRINLRGRALLPSLLNRPAATYPFSAPYDLAGAAAQIQTTLAATAAETVILPTNLLHVAPAIRAHGAMVVGDAVDILSQLTQRVLPLERRRPWRLPGLWINHLVTVTQERLLLPACNEIWASTAGEAEYFRERLPNTTVVVAGNTIDERTTDLSVAANPGRIGLIGNFALGTNVEAALFLAEKVFPRVRAVHPQATVALAGAGMPESIQRRLQATPGLDLLGEVASSSAFISSCAVMALTVRTRGGVPLKLIESMACGRPVVATNALIDGLGLVPGREILAGDAPQEIAAAISRVLGDAEYANSLARHARQRFDEDFSFAAMLERLRKQSLLAKTDQLAGAIAR